MEDRWTIRNDILALLTTREADDLALRETGRRLDSLGTEALHWLRELIWATHGDVHGEEVL